MIKILLAFLLSNIVHAADNNLEFYNDYVVDQSTMQSNETSLKYQRKINKYNDKYGLKIGETSLLYENEVLSKDNFVEINEIYHMRSGKSYWENYLNFSPDHTFLPIIKIEVNDNIPYTSNKEVGIGAGLRVYNHTNVFNLTLQHTWYIWNGDYWNVKINMPFSDGPKTSYSIYYNLTLSSYFEIRPYYSGGTSIEDINITDRYNLYGLQLKISPVKDFSISPFYEHYIGHEYRDIQKVGFKLSLDF